MLAKKEATDTSAHTSLRVNKTVEIGSHKKRGKSSKSHAVRRKKYYIMERGAGPILSQTAGSYPKRMRGGLEQEGEESFDAWREMQHKGNRGTNNLRGFHHLRLN